MYPIPAKPDAHPTASYATFGAGKSLLPAKKEN